MFKWRKLGKLFDPTEVSNDGWMREYAQAPSIIIFASHVRIYFSSRARPDEKGQYVSRLGYIDVRRDNLFDIIGVCKDPILSLGEIGTFDEFGTYPASAIKTENDVRVYYAGWTRCESVPFNASIGLAVSHDDGDTFERLGRGPVLSHSPDEPFVLGSPKVRRFRGRWYLWYSAGREWIVNEAKPEPVYKIRMAHSTDGIQWTKVGVDLINNVLEENECQASADVFYLQGRYHMLFSYRFNLNFREVGRGYRIGYAVSDDLVTWIRDDLQAGISVSAEGWDSESVSYPHVFELDADVYMLYQGNEIGRYGFGLAQLESHDEASINV